MDKQLRGRLYTTDCPYYAEDASLAAFPRMLARHVYTEDFTQMTPAYALAHNVVEQSICPAPPSRAPTSGRGRRTARGT